MHCQWVNLLIPSHPSDVPAGRDPSPHADEGSHGRKVSLQEHAARVCYHRQNGGRVWPVQGNAAQLAQGSAARGDSVCDLRVCEGETVWRAHEMELARSTTVPVNGSSNVFILPVIFLMIMLFHQECNYSFCSKI